MKRVRRRFVAALVLWAAASAGLACGGGAEAEPGFNLFSPEEDVAIGRESAEKVLAEMPVLRAPEIEAYMQEIGARLVAHAPGEKFPYTFRVLNVRELNAFALPGGIIFV